MSRIQLVQQAASPATPPAGDAALWADNTATPGLKITNPDGTVTSLVDSNDFSGKGVLLAGSAPGAYSALAAGGNGKVLAANSAVSNGVEWVDPVPTGSQAVATGGGFAADTYMTGSKLVIPTAGQWQAGALYVCRFDMVKTAAGVATPVLTVRMGTLGTTGDASIVSFTFGAGTAAADTGVLDLMLQFRSVGAGTSAVVAGVAELRHQLASTGLTSTGTAGYQAVPAASAGFNSTTPTTIGVSFNGGASFAGTNVFCSAYLLGTGEDI